MAFCKYCGATLTEDSVFCNQCGRQLNPQSLDTPAPSNGKAQSIVAMILGILSAYFAFNVVFMVLINLSDWDMPTQIQIGGIILSAFALIFGAIAVAFGRKTSDRTPGRMGKMFGLPGMVVGGLAGIAMLIVMMVR